MTGGKSLCLCSFCGALLVEKEVSEWVLNQCLPGVGKGGRKEVANFTDAEIKVRN